MQSSKQAWLRALEMTAPIGRPPKRIFPQVIDDLADRWEDAPALVSEHDRVSYRELAERSNQFARWALAQGLQRGDVVALLMANCPDYLAIWLGLTRVGCVVALINTNLIGDSLVHAVNVAKPKRLVFGPAHLESVVAAQARLSSDITCWAHGGDAEGFPRIDADARARSGARVDEDECAVPSLRDVALYIYTSGTTGLPKAANVTHHRLMQWGHWFAGLMDTKPTDRMYDCLPMYHSVGGIVAIGATLVSGGSVVLRERFSARSFWTDIVQEECTLFQYIGELCRFLVNSPPDPLERAHRIRLCCGNGLRPDVWPEFQERFAIPAILEFYAATEANFSLYNCEGKPGAIGRIPPFLSHRMPVVIVRFDHAAGEPLRNEQGVCERCDPGEIGEAISKIMEDAPGSRFEGYTDRAASERKILRDVFEPSDAWFRTGDLMRRDAEGFFYFVDRVGDTFRWKGENVSTTEVTEVISAFPGVEQAIVFGVALPGTDGRAGMAALVVDEGFDLDALRGYLADRLPEYARPVFLRILREIQMTGTFKPVKQELLQTGYDPSATTDPIYFNDRSGGAFVPMDADLFARLQRGVVRP